MKLESTVETFSQEDVQRWFEAELRKSGMTYAEWHAKAQDCSRRCGCALYEVSQSLAWAWKALRDYIEAPSET